MKLRITHAGCLVAIYAIMASALLGSCDQRIGKNAIPISLIQNSVLNESFLTLDHDLTSLEIDELIQYLKLHEETGWQGFDENEIVLCLETFKGNSELYELVSDFYLAYGSIEKALLYTSEAEANGANSAEFFKKKANVYMAIKEYGLAIDYLNKAVQINSNDPDIYLLKGDVYLKLKDSISALKYKEQAFFHDSSRLDIAFDMAYIYASENRNGEAYRLVNYLIDQSYKVEALEFLTVDLLRKEGKQEEANKKLSSLLNEGIVSAGEQLLTYFMHQKMYDSAIHYSTKILNRDSLNIRALEAKAVSFDSKGYFASASMYYNQMLAIDSLNKEAIEGVRKVNGKIAYLRKLRERREAIPTFDFATEKKETN